VRASHVPTGLESSYTWGIKSASAPPDAIVYEQFGSLHVYDLKTRKEHTINVRIAGDLP
jgi:hypothetical protein